MYTLALALQLTTLTKQIDTVDLHQEIPTHYVERAGYLDLSSVALPDTSLLRPVDTTKQTRGYVSGHPGIDYDARTGNPVYAAFAGTVTAVTHTGPYGNKILISHPTYPEHITTLYAHLSAVSVTVGQTVTAGETIGLVGATGNSDGDHLHFEVRISDIAVDPQRYF